MTAHDHRDFVDGCFRCDLSRYETPESLYEATGYIGHVPSRWEANLDLTDRQTKAVAKILRRLAARPNRRPETREACLAVAKALHPTGER